MVLFTIVGIEEIESVKVYVQCFRKTVCSDFIMILGLRMVWWECGKWGSLSTNLKDAVGNNIGVSGYECARIHSARYVEENAQDRRQIWSKGI